MENDCFCKTAAQCSWKKFLKWSLTSIQCPRWNFDFRNLQQAARKAKYCFSSIELLVNLTSNMAADCFEWAVEITIFIAELIRHHYEYTSTSHAYPLLMARTITCNYIIITCWYTPVCNWVLDVTLPFWVFLLSSWQKSWQTSLRPYENVKITKIIIFSLYFILFIIRKK